jgi:hypothetical protein
MENITLTETGCYLDNHRGHYITRDVIELAIGWGFIIDPFAKFAVDMYQDHDGDEEFPFEALTELADEACKWLNSGQDKCRYCDGGFVDRSKWANVDYIPNHVWLDKDNKWRCKYCTGTGRAPRIEGQNFPPIVPEGYAWDWFDGDFGLYEIDGDDLTAA